MKQPIRDRLSYSNVVATVAVFLALGGTSYALTLPRNSVGAKQLRQDSVGPSELRNNAVQSSSIDDRAIRLRDISTSARSSLRGQVGPRGPAGPSGAALFQSVDSGGNRITGNATSVGGSGPGVRLVRFGRSLESCIATASLTTLSGGPNPVTPVDAGIRVEPADSEGVLVRTFDAANSPQFYAFNLIVAC